MKLLYSFAGALRIFVFPALVLIFAPVQAEPSMDKEWGESVGRLNAATAERGQLFSDGNYAMFIHWGLYSQLGGQWKGQTYYGISEWIMHTAKIPVDEYRGVAAEFNPTDFDARAIARLAKDAGMKYVVITAKHHEGFAMFDSKVDPFNVVAATPFRRDPMKELAAACREEGLGFGFYYSHVKDWTTPGGSGGPKTDAAGNPVSFDDYFNKKCLPQVAEICSNYGQLEVVWFDTPGDLGKEQIKALYNLVREKQPHALVNSRIGKGMGDYASKGDMEVPLGNMTGLWETVDTANDSWAYAWYDQNWKSPKEILSRLIGTVARGGTYMLDVGPDGTGRIPETAARFLRQSGEWIKKYPQVVYAAGPSPWGHALPWGDVTTQSNTLLLSVFEWPRDGKLYLPGLRTEIASANIFNDDKTLPVSKAGDWTEIDVPAAAPDQMVSVIVVKLKDQPQADSTIGVYPNAESTLSTLFADVQGVEKKNISWAEKFGEWKHADQVSKWSPDAKVAWKVTVLEPGFYQVRLTYTGEKRIAWAVETDEGVKLQNQQGATDKYQTYDLGVLEFKKAGEHTLAVTLLDGNRDTTSLKALVIAPAE